MDLFIIVFKQVSIMSVLIAIGAFLYKKRRIDDGAVKGMSEILVSLVTPCVIVNAFQVNYSPELLKGFWISFGIAIGTQVAAIIIATVVFRKKKSDISNNYRIDRISIMFSNCGFMGIPLISAVLPENGVFYASSFIAALNIFVWTYGTSTLSGKKSKEEVLKMLTSPPILGIVAGLAMFLLKIRLPVVIGKPVEYLADMNTPLAMLIIGTFVIKSDILSKLKELCTYKVVFIKLIVMPLILILVFMFVKPAGYLKEIMLASTIATGCPSATINAIICEKYGCDTDHSSKIIAITTLLSVVTLPLIVFLLGKTMGMFA